MVINKIDLLPYLDYDVPAFCEVVQGLNPKAQVFQTSCKTGDGIEVWAEWLVDHLRTHQT